MSSAITILKGILLPRKKGTKFMLSRTYSLTHSATFLSKDINKSWSIPGRSYLSLAIIFPEHSTVVLENFEKEGDK